MTNLLKRYLRFCFYLFLLSTTILSFEPKKYLHVFSSYKDYTPQKMEVLGNITSINLQYSKNFKRREKTLVATLNKSANVRLDDTIYIVKHSGNSSNYKHAYLVGEAKIFSIFKTEFQGWMLQAKGFLQRIKKGYTIVKINNYNQRKIANELYQKAEIKFANKDYKSALVYFNQSLEKDSTNPKVYYKLALTEKELLLKSSYQRHLIQSFKYIKNFDDPNVFVDFLEEYFLEKLTSIKYDENFKLPKCEATLPKECKYLKYYIYNNTSQTDI